MSIRLYNDNLRESAKNPTHPTEDAVPKKPKNLRSRKIVVIIAVVAIILIVAIAGTVSVISHDHSPHVAIISEATAESFANEGFIARYINDTNGNVSLNVTEEDSVVFSNSSHNDMISAASTEFSSQSYSLYLYNKEYQDTKQGPNGTSIAGIQNGTYDGFNFFYSIQKNNTGYYNSFAFGVSGSFSFLVVAVNVPLSSSFMPLIYDEIQAMTA